MSKGLKTFRTVFRSSGRGQALIETALVVPFLMMIFVGGAELARIEYAAIEVSNAASAAVLYGAQNGGTYVDNKGMADAATMDAKDLQSVSIGTPTLNQVCVSETDGSSYLVSMTTSPACPSGYFIYVQISVLAQGTIDTLFHFPGLPSTITLYGQAKQRVVGD